MNFLNRCNGYSFAAKFSTIAYAKLEEVLPVARNTFGEYIQGDTGTERYHLGERYHSNSRVAERIESACTEAEFMVNPMAWALDGLRDCAGADHWYTFEKQWD